jgi:hypothetical protein
MGNFHEGPEPLSIKSSGIPHLAKNQRDVGHPSFVAGPQTMPEVPLGG